MRALSIHQPHAELIRLGVKTWETGRSWPMPASVIGERIAICSTVRLHRPGSGGSSIGEYLVGQTVMSKPGTGVHHLPLGVVRCTAVVAECAPVGGPTDFRTGYWDGDEGDFPGQAVIVVSPGYLAGGPTLTLDTADRRTVDITDQLPYGIWTPGTHATRLVDIVPTDPIPVKGRQRLWYLPDDVEEQLR